MRAVPLSVVPRGRTNTPFGRGSPPYSNDVAQRAGELRVEGEERLLPYRARSVDVGARSSYVP